jgi:hypothetical protein
MGNRRSSTIQYARVAPDESKSVSIEDELRLLEDSSFAVIPFNSLSADPWILPTMTAAKPMEQILCTQRRASEVLKMFVGLQTSRDSVYFLRDAVYTEKEITAYSPELQERIEIEIGIARPLLLGDQVHRYEELVSDNVVIFPYEVSDNESHRLIPASILESRFPKGWSYLKRCEAVLRGRENGRFDAEEWYQFGRMQGLKEVGVPKLLAPDISLGGNFSLDRTGQFYTTTTIYGYIKLENVWESYEYLLAVMNSKVLWFYLKTSGSVLANGYFRYKPGYIKKFPIPEVGRAAEATISTLVKCVLSEKTGRTDSGRAAFLEDLIEACVLECYFREHMAERDLLFLDNLAPALEVYDPKASEVQQRDFRDQLYRTLNAPKSPIRNRLLRLCADSPDLLAVIKAEGRV